MSEAGSRFLDLFDEDGRFCEGSGTLKVVFYHKDRDGNKSDLPGTLVFQDGLCVAATMRDGEDWRHPGNVPLSGVQFNLHLEGEDDALSLRIVEGKVFEHFDSPE